MKTSFPQKFLAVLGALVFLSSCETKPLNPAGHVTFWADRPDPTLVSLASTVQGLELTQSPVDQTWASLLKSGTNPPDLVFTDLSYEGQSAAREGLLADLTPYRGRLVSHTQQWRGLSELVDAEKRTYFVPSTVYLWRLFYNQDVLDRVGVKVPTTLAELEAAFATLRDHSVTPLALGSSFGWPALAWLSALDLQYNGVAAHRDLVSGRRLFSDASLAVVYETLVRWRERGWVDPDSGSQNWPESLAKVSEGSAGFVFLGSSVINRFRSAREIRSMPLPGKQGSGEKAQLAGVQGFYLNAKAKFPEAALALADLYLLQGVKGQVQDSYRLPAVAVALDPKSEGVRGQQSSELAEGASLVPLLDKSLEPRAAQNVNQVLIRFFAKGSRMTADDLASALVAAVAPAPES